MQKTLFSLITILLMSEHAWAKDNQWGGFYVGASVGYREIDSNWNTNMLVPSATGYSVAVNQSIAKPSFNSSSARLEGYMGYNFSYSPVWLLGLEVDFAKANNHKKIAGIPGASSLSPDNTEVQSTWDSSIRARAGYRMSSNTLIYGLGGISFINVQTTENCYLAGIWCGDANHSETYSKTMQGWTAGVGIETLLDAHWGARLEYRYSDYGSFTHTYLPPLSSDDNNATIGITSSLLNLGILYSF